MTFPRILLFIVVGSAVVLLVVGLLNRFVFGEPFLVRSDVSTTVIIMLVLALYFFYPRNKSKGGSNEEYSE